jgi:hypothetical protein
MSAAGTRPSDVNCQRPRLHLVKFIAEIIKFTSLFSVARRASIDCSTACTRPQ